MLEIISAAHLSSIYISADHFDNTIHSKQNVVKTDMHSQLIQTRK